MFPEQALHYLLGQTWQYSTEQLDAQCKSAIQIYTKDIWCFLQSKMSLMLLLAHTFVPTELIPNHLWRWATWPVGSFRNISEPFRVFLHYMTTTMCKEWVDVVESEIIKLFKSLEIWKIMPSETFFRVEERLSHFTSVCSPTLFCRRK